MRYLRYLRYLLSVFFYKPLVARLSELGSNTSLKQRKQAKNSLQASGSKALSKYLSNTSQIPQQAAQESCTFIVINNENA